MKTFTIKASGKTLSDVLHAIQEATRHIESGCWSGFDSNEDGSFSFDSSGEYADEDEDGEETEAA